MAATRILLGAAVLGLAVGPAFGQPTADGLFPPPPVADPTITPAQAVGSAASPLASVYETARTPPPKGTPFESLTTEPTFPSQYPPGAYPSPWVGGQSACCTGPYGKHGPLGYEIYSNTGVNFPFTGGAFIGTLKAGIMTGAGGRSLLFDAAGQRAWVFDLGVTYTTNGGDNDRILQVFTTPAPNAQTGIVETPDQVNSFRLRQLHRTSFNFGIGRDWWLNGPGNVNEFSGPNWRVGVDGGGRWGTAHVDLIPVGDIHNYYRRQGVYHGVYLGSHIDCEVPMGATVLFGGLRGQWGYDFMNIIPPMDGDIQNFNLLLTVGLRF